MSLKRDTTPVANLAGSLLASISLFIDSVSCVKIEQEKFFEIGCYFYRISLAIKELQTTERSLESAEAILKSLEKNVNQAKQLMEIDRGLNPEPTIIIAQLEEEIKQIGKSLSSIPSSTFGDEEDYAMVALQSLSNEFQNLHGILDDNLPVQITNQPNKESEKTETDLYPVDVEDELFPDNQPSINIDNLSEVTRSTRDKSERKRGNTSRSSRNLPKLSQYVEPYYESFFCPLTKEIMDDPVTIESGVTYERREITAWFEEFRESEEIFCPSTGQRLVSRVFSSNRALKSAIQEWKERNDEARIKIARAALSLASSESMLFEALEDLLSICKTNLRYKAEICRVGMLPLLIKILDYKDRDIRHLVLQLLHHLAEDDNHNKEMIAEALDISTISNMMSSGHQETMNASLRLLVELSMSQSLCEKIGSVPGAILMLIKIKYNQSIDGYVSEQADKILRNLEKFPTNIKRMAENGLLEPLLRHLTEGCEDTSTEMASYLGEIVLGHDSQTYVAETATHALVKMVCDVNTISRRAAFRALAQISSHQSNNKILAAAGTVQVMVEEIFTRTISDEPMNSKAEAASILANMLESGLEVEKLKANTHGHTMSSDYVVYNFIYLLKNSTPDELNINLIRILLCLTKFPKPMATIVSTAKNTETCYTLVEFMNSPQEELGVASLKLLISLSPYIGHTIADRLCKTRGQPENLIQTPTESTQIGERQALSVQFLATLPHQNITLNFALVSKNTVPTIIQTINRIQRSGSGTRTSKYLSGYLEGLVGILVRFTTTLYEQQILILARTQNLTSLFTELLIKTSSDEVRRLSAIALGNLSSATINLSKPTTEIKTTNKVKKFPYLSTALSFGSSKRGKMPLCPVHRGVCSAQNTFCLVEAKAVDRLLVCLDDENEEVVEAALSAISTLLDEKIEVEESLRMLYGFNAIKHVLNVVKRHKKEGLWQKSFWVIERFLVKGGDKSASDISEDRFFSAILVSAFHHGDDDSRQMAEKILRHLNMMPNFSPTNHAFSI